MTEPRRPGHVAVVGGGITGLAAAWELSRLADPPRVTVIEAGDRLGGKLQASPFAGLPAVDESADAFLARVPWGRELCAELGLVDLVSPATGTAYVWHGGRLHRIPDGLVLGVPADLAGLARSRLLSPLGIARAGWDLAKPRTGTQHDNLGRVVRDRFGAQVLERLVDPLVGSINAGDADQLSLEASTPQLAGPARNSRSLLRALRANRPSGDLGPVFLAPRGGMGELAATLAARLAEHPAVTLRCGQGATELARDGATWRVDGEAVDAVILAVPAFEAARLVGAVSPRAAATLSSIPYAGVVMVTAHLADPIAEVGSGYLVPKPVQGDVTAASFASHKWAHWQPEGGGALVRISLGRYGHQAPMDYDDDRAAQVALNEVSQHLGRPVRARAVRVGRWPRSFPQYLPHHLDVVGAAEHQLGLDAPGVVLAGAGYRGLGVPACIRQGREAARAVAR